MMQFGNVPTSGYFWLPAYIYHGALASEYGCIAVGRVGSNLFNHSRNNPWTTPVENAECSEARLLAGYPLLYHWASSTSHNHPYSPKDFGMFMPKRGDEDGHDAEHKSDGHRYHDDQNPQSHNHHHDH